MTQSEIASLAASVGFPDPQLAAAIAMGESSGNPRAYNGRGGDQSYGLWQINMIGALGPARRAQFGLSSNEDLFDPATNARVAVQVFQQQGYRAWGAYTNGSYKKYLGSDTGTTPTLPSLNLTPIDTPFGQVSPLWIGAAVLAYLLLK